MKTTEQHDHLKAFRAVQRTSCASVRRERRCVPVAAHGERATRLVLWSCPESAITNSTNHSSKTHGQFICTQRQSLDSQGQALQPQNINLSSSPSCPASGSTCQSAIESTSRSQLAARPPFLRQREARRRLPRVHWM